MKTNFQMLKELDSTFTPKRRGIVDMDEIYLIDGKLCISQMDELQLRNLRDFTVMYYTVKWENEKDNNNRDNMWDKMSAITTVIDNKLFNIGKLV